MAKTDHFREQHEELLGIAQEISGHLNAPTLSQDASKVQELLSQLMGTLKIHLAMEDKSLYPRLVSHSDEEVCRLAQAFVDEMGGIADAVVAYSKKWSTREKIQEDAETFVEETQGLFGALANRIDRENNELYPLLDTYG